MICKKLILSAMLLASTAHAEFRDGNKLLADINSSSVVDNAIVLGYVMGIADVTMGIAHCGPPNVTSGQIRDMVNNYLNNKPTERTKTGDEIVIYVLRTAWPCSSRGKGQSL